MDLFKIFPALFLDFISKVIPGSLFLVGFSGPYLPPKDLILQLFKPTTIPPEWVSWYSLAISLVTSYAIGIFIALAANATDSLLVKRRWYSLIRSAPNDYIYRGDQPEDLVVQLATPSAFALFVDHCRSYVSIGGPGFAVMLEKYQTVYRLFFASALLCVALPFKGSGSSAALFLIPLPLALWLTYEMSRLYLLKSIQCYSLAKAAVKSKPGGEDKALE